MNGERMHATGKFAGQRVVDHAVPLQPALSAERFRHNIKPEMGLASGLVAGMTGVLVRLVLHTQALRSESLTQLFCDQIARSHAC